MSEYIINTEQIEEINKAHGGMKTVTSWLSCYAIWDTSFTPPLMKSEHIAVELPGIVRCRDCIHYKPDPNPIDPGWPMWCEDTGRDLVQPDGFCAWGVRRES